MPQTPIQRSARYIKFLPKDKLLYELWLHAKPSKFMSQCIELTPVLTLEKAKRDIQYMIDSNRNLSLTNYYGRHLHVDLSSDYLITANYNKHNGNALAEKIIAVIQLEELCRTALCYYTTF